MLSGNRRSSSESDLPAPIAARIGAAAGYAGAVGDALSAGIGLATTEHPDSSAAVIRTVLSMVERLQAELHDLALDTGAAVLDDQAADP